MSIPFTSGNSFLRSIDSNNTFRRWSVSIPFTSGNSFLQNIPAFIEGANINVSIPFTSGNSFLLYGRLLWLYSEVIVSIPFTSGNSFLLTTIEQNGSLKMVCVNPLHVGELISTASSEELVTGFWCVNPLHVGELISTRPPGKRRRRLKPSLCQSPSRRGTHFYNTYITQN